jgi:hypothetical protein
VEKISGILPASRRITTVDLRGSGSVRAGTPNFGRPQGVSAAAQVASGADVGQVGSQISEQLENQLASIDRISREFFVKPEFPGVGTPEGTAEVSEPQVSDPMDLPEKGSQLDVVV